MAGVLLLPMLGGRDALGHGVLHAAGPVAAAQRHLLAIVAVVLVFVAALMLVLTPR